MKPFILPQTKIQTSPVIVGCMRINDMTMTDLSHLLGTSIEFGANFFDHADIYGSGQSEIVFAEAMKQLSISRDNYYLQSKVGIRDGFFDFSYDHIISSVDQILSRLKTDYLDILLLHRPDVLMEGEEVAKAFDELHQSGKVRYFGVSNQNVAQMELLSRYVDQPLIINQLQFGPAHTGLIDEELFVNMALESGDQRATGLLSYAQMKPLTIQAWSPYQVTLDQGLFMKHPQYKHLTETIQSIANQYQVPFEAIVTAWILRHPANIMPIVGTTKVKRLQANLQGVEIRLTRQEWYAIYQAQGRALP